MKTANIQRRRNECSILVTLMPLADWSCQTGGIHRRTDRRVTVQLVIARDKRACDLIAVAAVGHQMRRIVELSHG